MLTEVEDLLRNFMDSRKRPDQHYEELKRILHKESHEILEEAYREYRKILQSPRIIVPPYALSEPDLDNNKTWYPGADNIINAIYWPRLKEHLMNEKGWPYQTVNSIHHASDKIVSHLGYPFDPVVDTRGLVVGYVQSGKTANFTAVIAKAADAGYRAFIVLSGTKRSLRQQTQKRLESELVNVEITKWHTPTSNRDFSPYNQGNPEYFLDSRDKKVLFVVKKNSRILLNLITWLYRTRRDVLNNCPFLIIDDEADEASVNTARNQTEWDAEQRERTAINSRLVDLLTLLPKAAYIGYTATPFANVLIDPSTENSQDLYPRDFIIALPKPEGHFGTEKLFGRARLVEENEEEFEGIPLINIISEEDITKIRPSWGNRNEFEPEMPDSLINAVNYFWLGVCARIIKGQRFQHSTMLIHSTMFIRIHNLTRELVESYRKVQLRLLKEGNIKVLNQFKDLWEFQQEKANPREYFDTEPIRFNQISPFLIKALENTKVVVDNSKSEHRLNYDEPAQLQIVIGGNTLARGLTLEGLIVSYFVRAARAYDTLLQMGRWFGYRHGYEEIPRIWMPQELKDQFHDLALVEAELRTEFEKYSKKNITPSEYGPKIRTHPNLSITSRLKMQFAVDAKVSFSSQRVQTILFKHKDYDWLQQNINAASQFISNIIDRNYLAESVKGHHIFYKVDTQHIIKFLRRYKFHPYSDVNEEVIRQYISAQQNKGKLIYWNVAIRGLAHPGKVIEISGIESPLITRTKRINSTDYANLGALMSESDLRIDKIGKFRDDDQDRGLLILYPVDKDSKVKSSKSKADLNAINHLLGLGFVFPDAGEDNTPQSYKTVDPSLLTRDDYIEEQEDEDEEE